MTRIFSPTANQFALHTAILDEMNFGFDIPDRSRDEMVEGLSLFVDRGAKVKPPVRVHSWLHSYPSTKPSQGQPIYLEINGKLRMWQTHQEMELELGSNYVLLMHDKYGCYTSVSDVLKGKAAA
jgi:hypothetical protein